MSKLYTCIDLKKYDEAIQTCNDLLALKARRRSSENVPNPEEKCVRAIVGGSLQCYHDARATGDDVAVDSARRTLGRVGQLLDKMKETTDSGSWLYEVSARFNDEMGRKEEVFGDLMRQYRSLQAQPNWEEGETDRARMVSLVAEIVGHHKAEGTREGLVKGKLLANGVAKRIRSKCEAESEKELKELGDIVDDIQRALDDLKNQG